MSPDEAELWELHLVVWSIVGWDMKGFDSWLDDPAEWKGREHVHKQFHDEREGLRHAFRQRADDSLIEALANGLLRLAKAEAMHRKGFELELEQGAGIEQRRSAGKLGGSKTDELRGKIMAVLGRERRAGRELKEILSNWRQHGPEDGLRLTYRRETDDYEVEDENGDEAPRTYKFSGFEGMFADAAKPSTGRKRR